MKKLIAIGVAVVISSFIWGCNAGTTNTITASTNNNCSPISSAQCLITLTYTSTNSSNLGAIYTPSQLSQFTFATSLSQCPAPSSSSQTCTIAVNYSSTGTPVSESIVYTLGGATSNTITLSGN